LHPLSLDRNLSLKFVRPDANGNPGPAIDLDEWHEWQAQKEEFRKWNSMREITYQRDATK